MYKVIILFSGRGTNLLSVINESNKDNSLFKIDLAITDNPNAFGIQYPHTCGIDCTILPEKKWEEHLLNILDKSNPDLIVLAGFMKVLHNKFCLKWDGKCINIHPSLLPKYPGLNTHQQVLKNSDKEHGCSIHLVTPIVDGGKVIAQSSLNVLFGEDIGHLSHRVLKMENDLLPAVVKSFAEGRLRYYKGTMYFEDTPIFKPLNLGDLL